MSDKEKIKAVKSYLYQYISCRNTLKSLERRIRECEEDFNDPSIGGSSLGCSGGTSCGAASLTYRQDELKTLYIEQSAKAKETMSNIVKSVLSVPFCDGRKYVELRYLTGLSVRNICRQEKISHTTYYTEFDKALLLLYDVLEKQGIIKEAPDET